MAYCRTGKRLAGLFAAGSLLAALPALAARPSSTDPVGDEASEERAPGVELDDAAARMRALREWNGNPDPASRWRVLQEALRERDRWSTAVTPDQPVAAAGSANVFVNIGPTRADKERNGYDYTEMDSGRARQIVPHPSNPNILYMATSGGGVWKTYDAGGGWEPLTEKLGTLSVGALAMDPASPEILYLGYGDPFDVQLPGVVKSADGGQTWSSPIKLTTTDYTINGANPTLTADSVRDIKVDPLNSANVLVATNAGLFRSTNGGNSFTHVNLPAGTPLFTEIWSIAYAGPTGAESTWVVTGEGFNADGTAAGMGIWRSVNSGAAWTSTPSILDVTKIGRTTLSASLSTTDSAATSRLFLLTAKVDGSAQENVYRSDDGGTTWLALRVNSTGRPTNPNSDQPDLDIMRDQAWYNQALLADPFDPNLVYVGGQLSTARSTDGGVTWSVMSNWLPAQGISRPYVHADLHAFAVSADGTFWAGSDGGLFRSPDPAAPCASGNCGARTGNIDAVNFTSTRNEGLTTHLVYHVACAPSTWAVSAQNFVAGGLQDNGTRARSGSSTTFDQVVGGDGIGLAVSGDTTSRPSGGLGPKYFITSVAGGIYRSGDGGENFSKFSIASLPFFVRITRDVADADPAVFLTFNASSVPPPAVFISRGGADWAEVPTTLHWPGQGTTPGFTTPTNGPIGLRNISTHPGKAGTWGLVSNNYAYISSNSGGDYDVTLQAGIDANGFGVWTLSSVAFDPADLTGNTVYITSKSMTLRDSNNAVKAMPNGYAHLWKTTNRGQTWTAVGAGQLPFVPFDVVKFDPADTTGNTIYVGTEIGLYRSTDKGANWTRYGAGVDAAKPLGLPLVEVTDLCFAPGSGSDHVVVSTFGRGFWQIGTDAVASTAGVRGRGDTDFNQRIDGRDLLDLADAFGATQANSSYRYQADMSGTSNAIGDEDVTALLAKFGGTP